MNNSAWAVGLAAILGAGLAHAQCTGSIEAPTCTAPSWPLNNPPEGWRPAPFDAGSWFDRERDGAGWAIEKLSPLAGQTNPLYAGTVYTYDSTGKPYWLLMAGTLQYTGWNEYFRTSVSAKFAGVLNDGVNGACPTCSYVAPNVGPSAYGTGEIRFLDAAQADVYVNNGSTHVERLETSEHILLNAVADLLEGEWRRQTYVAAGSFSVNPYIDRIYEITPPAWASALTADANVMHKPRTTDRWFITNNLDSNYPLVLDSETGSLRRYCFDPNNNCGTEVIGNTGGLGVQGRVGFHMSANARIELFSFIDKDTIVYNEFINDRSRVQNSTQFSNKAFRYRREIPRWQQ